MESFSIGFLKWQHLVVHNWPVVVDLIYCKAGRSSSVKICVLELLTSCLSSYWEESSVKYEEWLDKADYQTFLPHIYNIYTLYTNHKYGPDIY